MSQNNSTLQTAAHLLIRQLMNTLYGMRGCVISTEDGFLVAAHMLGESSAKLSAIASSIAALGVVAGDENKLGTCNSMVVEAEAGAIVIAQARRPDVTLVLSLVANKDAILGQLLYAARDAARQLEQLAVE